LWSSAIVAALFAWHPVQVESVAWISERKGLLCAFFGLLAIWFYSRHVQKDNQQESATAKPYFLSSTNYWAALILFALALMSKPMLVTLPCLLLFLDFWPLKRCGKNTQTLSLKWFPLISEKIPFLLVASISTVTTVLFQESAGVLQPLAGYSASSRIENFFVSYAHYLGKFFWPANLATPYPRVFHWNAAMLILSVLILAGGCSLAIGNRRKWPFAFMGWFWFFGMLIPVSGIIQAGAQTVADRYAYLPMVGCFVIVVWAAGEFCLRWKLPKILPVIAATIVLVACAARTRYQLPHWSNSETLCRHTIAVSKDNFIAYYCLGWFYDQQGRAAEAFENYRRAAEIKPNYGDPWNGMGCLLTDRKDYIQAVPCFESAVRAKPDRVEFRYNYARALAMLNRSREAIEQYREVVQLKPDFAPARGDLGTLLFRQREFANAIVQLEESVRLEPGNPLTQFALAKSLVASGRIAEAIDRFQTALRLQPNFTQARNELRALGITEEK
jgi:Flp pilus assembly protein TadD